MDIVQIVAILLAVIVVFLAISNWHSKSRNTTDFYHYPYERSSHDGYWVAHGEPAADGNDHHSDVDSGGGGDWGGGDAGSGEGGGGGE